MVPFQNSAWNYHLDNHFFRFWCCLFKICILPWRLYISKTTTTLFFILHAFPELGSSLLRRGTHFPCPWVGLGYQHKGASLVTQKVKNSRAMQETGVLSLGWEDCLEKGMAIHSSILAWRIPWAEEPGRPRSIGSHRVGPDWSDLAHVYPADHHFKISTWASYRKSGHLSASCSRTSIVGEEGFQAWEPFQSQSSVLFLCVTCR